MPILIPFPFTRKQLALTLEALDELAEIRYDSGERPEQDLIDIRLILGTIYERPYNPPTPIPETES